jgi:hypothetical protein
LATRTDSRVESLDETHSQAETALQAADEAASERLTAEDARPHEREDRAVWEQLEA